MTKWEYKIVTSSDEDDELMLNELGDDGWELISVHVSEVTYVDATEDDGEEDEEEEGEEYTEEVVSYYLKRAKSAA